MAVSDCITCDFHPQFIHRKFGVDFGERYQNDPVCREKSRQRTAIALSELFCQYTTIFPEPEREKQNIDWIGFQPLDFLNAALGGGIHYSPEEEIWTTEKPFARKTTLAEIAKLPDIVWETNPVYTQLLHQLAEMEMLRPGVICDGVQGANYIGNGKAKLSIHTPYTTAFRLMGEEIFELMMLEPETADALFDYIFRQYYNQAAEFCKSKGWQLTEIHFGDCAATMLSPALFKASNARIAAGIMDRYNFKRCTQHSCGPSTHLLEAFLEIPRIGELQLGYGTDLALARKLFPQARITAYYAASALLTESPQQIKANLRQMTTDLQNNFHIIGSAIDINTPPGNLAAFLDTAQEFNISALQV